MYRSVPSPALLFFNLSFLPISPFLRVSPRYPLICSWGAGTVSPQQSPCSIHLLIDILCSLILHSQHIFIQIFLHQTTMRWSLALSAAIVVMIPVFSTPIPRMLLRKRGLFEQTLQSTSQTPESLAAMVTNALTSDPAPCE